MGRRCGEQLGESLREIAMAQLATEGPNRDAAQLQAAPDNEPPSGSPSAKKSRSKQQIASI